MQWEVLRKYVKQRDLVDKSIKARGLFKYYCESLGNKQPELLQTGKEHWTQIQTPIRGADSLTSRSVRSRL